MAIVRQRAWTKKFVLISPSTGAVHNLSGANLMMPFAPPGGGARHFTLTTSGGGLSADATGITVNLSPANTEAIPAGSKSVACDLVIISGQAKHIMRAEIVVKEPL